MKLLSLLVLFFGFALQANAATYFVRTDGGTFAQCNGLTDAPYSAGTSNCAWNHPFIALPPVNNEHHVAPRIAAGDTLMIGSGSYRMGYGASAETSVCYSNAMYDCKMQRVPAGLDASHPTRIIGNCDAPPELWADQGAYAVLDLTQSSNTEVSCLEITDHDSCIINHCFVDNCTGTPDQIDKCMPGDSFGNTGLISTDASNVTLDNINIHGMGNTGVHAGRLTDWTVNDMRLWANGYVGWDGDVNNGGPQNSSNSGNLIFDNLTVGWSGCGERYPGGEIFGCWDQNEGGYGDGMGTGRTGGNWVFTNSTFVNNASDGLDLLYADGTGSIVVDNMYAKGNAGNQVKVAGPSKITNSVVLGSCAQEFSVFPPNNYDDEMGYNPGQFVGKYNMELSGNCRASGDSVATASTNGSATVLVNNTISGQGGCLVLNTNGNLPGATVLLANNVLNANHNIDWLTFATGGGAREVCGFYQMPEGGGQNVTFASNVFWGARNAQCPMGNFCGDPMLTNNDVVNMDPVPKAGSPVLDAGDPAYCTQAGLESPCNIGAIQGTAEPPPPPSSGFIIKLQQGLVVHYIDDAAFGMDLVDNVPVGPTPRKGQHWVVTQGTTVVEFPNSTAITVSYRKATAP